MIALVSVIFIVFFIIVVVVIMDDGGAVQNTIINLNKIAYDFARNR